MNNDPEQASVCRIGCPVRAEANVDLLMEVEDVRRLCNYFATQLVLREVAIEPCPLRQAAQLITDNTK